MTATDRRRVASSVEAPVLRLDTNSIYRNELHLGAAELVPCPAAEAEDENRSETNSTASTQQTFLCPAVKFCTNPRTPHSKIAGHLPQIAARTSCRSRVHGHV